MRQRSRASRRSALVCGSEGNSLVTGIANGFVRGRCRDWFGLSFFDYNIKRLLLPSLDNQVFKGVATSQRERAIVLVLIKLCEVRSLDGYAIGTGG